jgi:transposase
MLPSLGLTNTAQELKKSHYQQAIGRSAGGLSTKIHVLADGKGRPIAFHLTAGNAHDLQGADALLERVNAGILLADRAYNAKERVVDKLKANNCLAVIPPKSNARDKPQYDKQLYRARHLIENFFAHLKQYRAIATRYDKLATNFLGGIYLASIIIWSI